MHQERDASYNHVLKYTGIFGGVQGLNIIINLVRNKLVALLLGPDGMGLASLFNTTVNFISQSTNLGISFSAVKHISSLYEENDEEKMAHFVKVVRVWSLITALVGMAICVLIGPLLSDYSFSWGDHTLHFILLSPAVGLMAITGGETAILKGMRRLRSLATIQVYTVFAALFISVPLYYFFGQTAIVPVIVSLILVSMLLTISYSYRLYPLRLRGSRGILGEGMSMVKLGVAFVVAGIMGSGAEMLVRSYLNVTGNLDVVGLYNAGFVLTITYASMVFSSMEADYFPRLSSVSQDVSQINQTVNRQIEVSLLVAAPMLAVLIIGLPVLMPLLYSSQFIPVIAMAQVAVFSMYVKSISLPISYITLAKGDSIAYMVLESCYDVIFVLLIIAGYQLWGHYHYRMSGRVLFYTAIQLALGIAVYVVSLIDNQVFYWLLGSIFCVVSMLISVFILRRHAEG